MDLWGINIRSFPVFIGYFYPVLKIAAHSHERYVYKFNHPDDCTYSN